MHSPAYDFVNMSGSDPIAIPSVSSPQLGWHVPGFHEHLEGYHSLSGKSNRLGYLHQRPLQRLQTGLSSSYDDTLSVSTGTLSTYSDSDYGSPSEYPQTPDELPMMGGPLFPPYNDQYLAPHTPMSSTDSVSYTEAPRSYPYVGEELGTSMASDHSGNHSVHSGVHSGSVDPNYPDIFYQDDIGSSPLYNQSVNYNYRQRMANANGESVKQEEGVLSQAIHPTLGSSVPHTQYSTPSYKMTTRMQYLLDYYDKSICPFLVAFDSPSNPYRMHVMHLAATSEGLQNAIAALSTNNMRMRGQKELGQLAYDNSGYRYSQMTAQEFIQLRGEPSAEELQYKARSIELLNAQLADPERAKDDSVLATLLILCLFHVSDSGFTKFTTQLAGVQKLLSMRDSAVQSGFIGLIELFFTWFDVMTSTVNDRESQFRADSLDIVNITANLGALEHLVGCDGRLFKLIARLGRLNLLSQNRSVCDTSENASQLASQLSLSSMKGSKDYYSLQFPGRRLVPRKHGGQRRGTLRVLGRMARHQAEATGVGAEPQLGVRNGGVVEPAGSAAHQRELPVLGAAVHGASGPLLAAVIRSQLPTVRVQGALPRQPDRRQELRQQVPAVASVRHRLGVRRRSPPRDRPAPLHRDPARERLLQQPDWPRGSRAYLEGRSRGCPGVRQRQRRQLGREGVPMAEGDGSRRRRLFDHLDFSIALGMSIRWDLRLAIHDGI